MHIIVGEGILLCSPQTLYNLAETILFQNFPGILENQEFRMSVVFPLMGLLKTEVTILTICHLKKGRFIALTKKALVTSNTIHFSREKAPLVGATAYYLHVT